MYPNKSFKVFTRIISDSQVNYSGSEETMAKFKYSGIKLPMIMHSYRADEESVKTGSLRSDSSFEVSMKFDYDSSLTIRNGDTLNTKHQSLAGLKMVCVYTKDHKMTGIEVIGNKLPDNLKQEIAKMAEDMYKKIKYPKKPLKIGDTFTQYIPTQIPLGSYPPIDMKIEVTYKLMKVDEHRAYFNTVTKMSLIDSLGTIKINLKGRGTGNSIHDLQKNFAIEHNSEMTLKEVITTNVFKTIVTSKSKTYYNVVE